MRSKAWLLQVEHLVVEMISSVLAGQQLVVSFFQLDCLVVSPCNQTTPKLQRIPPSPFVSAFNESPSLQNCTTSTSPPRPDRHPQCCHMEENYIHRAVVRNSVHEL